MAGTTTKENVTRIRLQTGASGVERVREGLVEPTIADHVWPLRTPRSAPGTAIPWAAILDATADALKAAKHSG